MLAQLISHFRVLREQLILFNSAGQESFRFYAAGRFIPCSQKSTTGHGREPDEPKPRNQRLSL